MHLRRSLVLCAALGAPIAGAGCRAIDGLGGLRFDRTSATGSGGAGSGGSGSHADAGSPDAGGAGAGGANAGGAGAGGAGAGGADAGDGGGGGACAPTGYDCEAPPPPGWAGPVAFYEGAPGTVPACPAEYPSVAATGTSGVSAPPATCGACTCGAPAVTCSAAPLDLYASSSCPSPAAQTLMLVGGACTPVPGMDTHFVQEAPAAAVGACAPAGGTPDAGPLAWTTEGAACGPPAAPVSCADGTLCAPAPAAPFAPRWCVWAAGAQACPPAFPEGYVWETGDDQRGCTPCVCGASGPATCTVTTALYNDGACNDPIGSIGTVGQCVYKQGVHSALATTSPSGSPGCPAGGGSPTGAVVTTPAVTICCPGS